MIPRLECFGHFGLIPFIQSPHFSGDFGTEVAMICPEVFQIQVEVCGCIGCSTPFSPCEKSPSQNSRAQRKKTPHLFFCFILLHFWDIWMLFRPLCRGMPRYGHLCTHRNKSPKIEHLCFYASLVKTQTFICVKACSFASPKSWWKTYTQTKALTVHAPRHNHREGHHLWTSESWSIGIPYNGIICIIPCVLNVSVGPRTGTTTVSLRTELNRRTRSDTNRKAVISVFSWIRFKWPCEYQRANWEFFLLQGFKCCRCCRWSARCLRDPPPLAILQTVLDLFFIMTL